MVSQIVSASQAGDIQFLDVSRAAEPYLMLAVHRHAPVVASGSAKQMIKVFSLEEAFVIEEVSTFTQAYYTEKLVGVILHSFHTPWFRDFMCIMDMYRRFGVWIHVEIETDVEMWFICYIVDIYVVFWFIC
jgi:hypothetical protein